jgi:hypothetical protein
MKTFTHPNKIHWTELTAGQTVNASSYNSKNPANQIMQRVCKCTAASTCLRTCFSGGKGIILNQNIFHCIFNPNGKSFWEEVEDAL